MTWFPAPVFLGIFLQKTLNISHAHTALSEVLQAGLFPQMEPSRVSCCGLRLKKTRKKRSQSLRQTVAFEKPVFWGSLRLFCLSEVGKIQTLSVYRKYKVIFIQLLAMFLSPSNLDVFRFSVVCGTVLPGQRRSNPSVVKV